MTSCQHLKIDVKDAPKPKSFGWSFFFPQVSCKKKHMNFPFFLSVSMSPRLRSGTLILGATKVLQCEALTFTNGLKRMVAGGQDANDAIGTCCHLCWSLFLIFFLGGGETIDFDLSPGLCPLLMFWHWCEVRTVEKIECLNESKWCLEIWQRDFLWYAIPPHCGNRTGGLKGATVLVDCGDEQNWSCDVKRIGLSTIHP